MLAGKNFLIIGARAGGYGAAIAKEALKAGANVFGTTLNPDDPREKLFFKEIGTTLIDVPLRYDVDKRDQVFDQLKRIQCWFKDNGVYSLDAIVHTVAGGFPRQPSVMKAVSDILKGRLTFSDLATAVKRNVYYVNAGSFDDTINALSGITNENTQFVALSYRGNLPYFISPTKKYLEKIAIIQARKGKQTLIAALPEAWTQSSQFFTGIEIAVLHNYLQDLSTASEISSDLKQPYTRMRELLAQTKGLDKVVEELQQVMNNEWASVNASTELSSLSGIVQGLFTNLREKGIFHALRASVEIISDYVREASAVRLVNELIGESKYQPGDVRQIFYRDLLGNTPIGLAKPREETKHTPGRKRRWLFFDKEEIAKTLNMYGKNFLFLDHVVMEDSEMYDGFIGYACFVVPSPDENPILKDHFVGMPLFGGHLQMEAVAQFGTFLILQASKDKRLIPILTGTEFPDLNTMAPPGEKLTMMGVIRIPEKRTLSLEAFIENRFARSKGTIRGMVLNERLVRKMVASFNSNEPED